MIGWTPTNITDVRQQSIDSVVGINGVDSLILQKIDVDTFYNLNVFSGHSGCIAPNGYDRYILGFWFETFDENHFLNLYNSNPRAQFVVITDMLANDLDKFDRCKHVQLYHWKYFLNYSIAPVDFSRKKYKISSLSNRVNQYKFFVTAKLLNLDDVYMTWNATYLEGAYYKHIFSSTGWPVRDSLLTHAKQLMQPVNQEKFVNSPDQVLATSSSSPAYTESLVNLINETKDNSWHQEFGILPGPYVTEKTWKPLLQGNALIFSGQHNIKRTLEQFNFKFDYPWIDNYSSTVGDLERLDNILLLIDQILGMSAKQIEDGIAESVLHNQNLILSGQLHKKIDQVNQQGLDTLATIL